MTDKFPEIKDASKPPEDVLAALKQLSMHELERLCNEVQDERNMLRNVQLVIQKVISERVIMENAARKLATATDDEKRAMLQLLMPKSIESKEKVNEAGGLQTQP